MFLFLSTALTTKVNAAINSMLGAGPVAVAERLPALLADMQRDILGTSSSSVLILDVSSALLCQAHTCALRYRAEKTDDLFKLPLEDRNSVLSSCASWMSDGDLLKVYEVQLQQIKAVSSSSIPTSGGVRGEVHAQVLASALLDGYRDALNYAPTEDKSAVVTSYHSAKVLSIPLLRLYDPSDMWPFDLSVDHGYFDGVFDICHDWMVGSKRFEDEPDAEEKKEDAPDQQGRCFDLKPILEACSAVAAGESSGQEALYKDLMPPSVDPPSGLTFPQFVLKRYADLGLQGILLDLGRLCPSDLETFVEEDKRMSDHRWIVRVRSGKHGGGRDGLVDVVKDGAGGQNFADRELTLSLAKLCNSIDAPSSTVAAGMKPPKQRFVHANAGSASMGASASAQLVANGCTSGRGGSGSGTLSGGVRSVADMDLGRRSKVRGELQAVAIGQLSFLARSRELLAWVSTLSTRTRWERGACYR